MNEPSKRLVNLCNVVNMLHQRPRHRFTLATGFCSGFVFIEPAPHSFDGPHALRAQSANGGSHLFAWGDETLIKMILKGIINSHHMHSGVYHMGSLVDANPYDRRWVHITPETIALTVSKGAGKSEYVAAGDLDQGAPNHTDHSKRGFTPK